MYVRDWVGVRESRLYRNLHEPTRRQSIIIVIIIFISIIVVAL